MSKNAENMTGKMIKNAEHMLSKSHDKLSKKYLYKKSLFCHLRSPWNSRPEAIWSFLSCSSLGVES